MIRGVLFYIAMLGRYPATARAPISLQVLLNALDAWWLAIGRQIAIFGTLIQARGDVTCDSPRLRQQFHPVSLA